MEIEPGLVHWLIWKLKGVLTVDGDEPKVGLFGSRRRKEMDLVVNVRKNKGGFFVSKLCFTGVSYRSYRCICLPKGTKSYGWWTFVKAAEWFMCDSPALSTVQIKRKEVEKVEAEKISHEAVTQKY